jgi:hypothetical protein
MALTHPLHRLSASTQKRALPPLIIATLALTAVLQVIGRPLQTAAAPLGIVSFELAGTLAAAQAMLASWDPNAQLVRHRQVRPSLRRPVLRWRRRCVLRTQKSARALSFAWSLI